MIEMASEELADLRKEIERLTRELDQACREKIQAAEYGLQVLEEKQNTQQKCEDLETLYETTKQELDIVKDVSMIIQKNFKKLSVFSKALIVIFHAVNF